MEEPAPEPEKRRFEKAPPPRPRREEGRRGAPRRQMSIEEELEADLRAANVGPSRSDFTPPVIEAAPPVPEPDDESGEFVETAELIEPAAEGEAWQEPIPPEADEEVAPRHIPEGEGEDIG